MNVLSSLKEKPLGVLHGMRLGCCSPKSAILALRALSMSTLPGLRSLQATAAVHNNREATAL